MPEKKQKVYFGKEQTKKFYLPETDEQQWIEHKKFNEGQRRKYEDATSRKVSMNTGSNTVEMDMAIGSDRKALFDTAVVGYKVLVEDNNGQEKEYSDYNNADWEGIIRDKMSSDISQALLEDIRKFNPWLQPAEQGKKK